MSEEVPEGICGFRVNLGEWDLIPAQTTGDINWQRDRSTLYCKRETWSDYDQCIWHVDIENKPLEELVEKRGEDGERLDGAILRSINMKDSISFDHCSLLGADFSDSDLQTASFVNSDLKRASFCGANLCMADFSSTKLSGADFTEAIARNADFSTTDSVGANFSDAILPRTKFAEADLRGATFTNANLWCATLRGANLMEAELIHANLRDTDITNGCLDDADLTNAELQIADLTNATILNTNLTACELENAELIGADLSEAIIVETQLLGANLNHANLQDANLTDANVRWAKLENTVLENAILTRTDVRETSFLGADLYQIQFSDTRINSQTKFGEICSYEAENRQPRIINSQDGNPIEIPPLEAATWVYRRLEDLHEKNALASHASQFHIRKEETQRAQHRKAGNYGKFGVSTINRYLTLHGESLAHVVISSAVVIFMGGLLYPFSGFLDGNEIYRTSNILNLLTPHGLETLGRGLYFSIITFSTIGYANVAPIGPFSRILVGFQSLIGATLIALFVYVLGRRVAR